MSNPYKDHPGGGFTPVKGYEPPAGTQAAQIRDQERYSGGGSHGGAPAFPATRPC